MYGVVIWFSIKERWIVIVVIHERWPATTRIIAVASTVGSSY